MAGQQPVRASVRSRPKSVRKVCRVETPEEAERADHRVQTDDVHLGREHALLPYGLENGTDDVADGRMAA